MRKIYLALCYALITMQAFSQQVTKGNDGLFYTDGDKLFSGTHKEYFDDGRIRTVMLVDQGQLDGDVQIFFPNGQLHEIRAFQDGLKHGLWIEWNEEGRKIAEARYDKGQKDGKWYVWNEHGVLLYDMTYSGGVRSGTWRMYDAEGNLISERNH